MGYKMYLLPDVPGEEETVVDLDKPDNYSLLELIEEVVNIAVACHLDDMVYVKVTDPLRILADCLDVTPKQALLFSLLMEYEGENIDRQDSYIADKLCCRRVRVLSLFAEGKALAKRGYIRMREYCNSTNYAVPQVVKEAVRDNDLTKLHRKGLTEDEFFEVLDGEMDEDVCSHYEVVMDLIQANMHLQFCKVYCKYFPKFSYDGLMFLSLANSLISRTEDMVEETSWFEYFDCTSARKNCVNIHNRKSELITRKLVEPVAPDGFQYGVFYQITENARAEFFAGMDVMLAMDIQSDQMLSHKELVKKEMYYNERERRQIERLSSLISKEQFDKVQRQLEENGMRKGFACLFYGTPGTGKTETVYQLARESQRDLFLIDVAKIKNCYVGESEKNMTKAFTNYRHLVESCKRKGENIPILLFNEADAVLGIRMEGAQKEVDKSSNSIQNIILQEMERLDGIMIATTNLTSNLDKAFERRFIYKIEFSKPTAEAKRSIWQSMIPALDADNVVQLATSYDFSGGQIENIARKYTVEKVLSGENPTLEEINDFCKHETLRRDGISRIGFCER